MEEKEWPGNWDTNVVTNILKECVLAERLKGDPEVSSDVWLIGACCVNFNPDVQEVKRSQATFLSI